MTTPDRIDHLQDRLDLFTAILIGGCLFFFVGGVLGVFAAQDFASGTNFMQHLAGAEQAIGLLMIITGAVKVHSIKVELQRSAPAEVTGRSAAAKAGE